MEIKTFDIVNPVVSITTEELRGEYVLNERALDVLHQYCDYVDAIMKDFEGISVDVEVNEDHSIDIEMKCPSVYTESRKHPFNMLVTRAISVTFKTIDEDALSVTLRFPTVWDPA